MKSTVEKDNRLVWMAAFRGVLRTLQLARVRDFLKPAAACFKWVSVTFELSIMVLSALSFIGTHWFFFLFFSVSKWLYWLFNHFYAVVKSLLMYRILLYFCIHFWPYENIYSKKGYFYSRLQIRY